MVLTGSLEFLANNGQRDTAVTTPPPCAEANAQGAVLSAVSQRVPMKEHRARAYVSVGVGLATVSCVLDGILSYPFAVVRWQCEGGGGGGGGLPLAAAAEAASGVVPLLGTHLIPWLLGQGSSGVSAWRSMKLGTLSDVFFHGCRLCLSRHPTAGAGGRARRLELRPPFHPGIDAIAALVAFPFEAAKYRAAVLGWSSGVVGVARLTMLGLPFMSFEWALTHSGARLVALSVCHAVARSAIVQATTRVLAAPTPGTSDDKQRTMANLYVRPLRALLVADVVATVLLLPLEGAVVRGHILAAGGSISGSDVLYSVVLRSAVIVVFEAVVRAANAHLTDVLSELFVSDISPANDDNDDNERESAT
jgi:hypothetical protein